MRVLIEICTIVAGLVAAALIASFSAWGYPRGAADIWLAAYFAMAVTLLLGARAVWRAWRKDRETLQRKSDDA